MTNFPDYKPVMMVIYKQFTNNSLLRNLSILRKVKIRNVL